jgi:hypothetical protein
MIETYNGNQALVVNLICTIQWFRASSIRFDPHVLQSNC